MDIDGRTLAWILYAIDVASGNVPASRTDISNAADAINHAVPAHRELEGALRWLVASGLVEAHGKRHALSPSGQALLGGARGSHHTVTAVWQALTREMSASIAASGIE